MSIRLGRLASWTLATFAAFAILALGSYAGFKIGFAVRDCRAIREAASRDADYRAANLEAQELRIRMVELESDLKFLVRRHEDRLGLEPRLSEGD